MAQYTFFFHQCSAAYSQLGGIWNCWPLSILTGTCFRSLLKRNSSVKRSFSLSPFTRSQFSLDAMKFKIMIKSFIHVPKSLPRVQDAAECVSASLRCLLYLQGTHRLLKGQDTATFSEAFSKVWVLLSLA